MTVQQRIQKFLQDHPTGTLQVAVAYATPWGFDWLNQHTQGRRTNLLIGNIPENSYDELSDRERQNALAFLNRSEVTISNWKRSDDGKTRISAWLVINKGSYNLLIGSANLNGYALKRDDELMVEVAKTDIRASVREMRSLYEKAKDCRRTLIERIQVDGSNFSNWG